MSASRGRVSLLAVGFIGVVLLLAGMIALSGNPTPENAGSHADLPAELKTGEAVFNARCAGCHGVRGSGTQQGPPLVHKIYEPSHHGDAAFQRAAANGVRAHHWQFGDMPKVEGIRPDEVAQVIKYVRWLQRQAGIM